MLYDDSNLPYVEIIPDEEGRGVAEERSIAFDCQYRYITEKQAKELREEYARKSRTLGHSAIMPAITED